MKKVKTFFIILINIMFFYCNEIYATTTGTYVPSESNGIEKFILIGIGIIAIVFVLFIGYKMDKREESKKRREKFIQNNNNENKVIQEKNIVDNYEEKYVEEAEEVYEEEAYEEEPYEDSYVEEEEIPAEIDEIDISAEDILEEYVEDYTQNEEDYTAKEYEEDEVDEEYIADEKIESSRSNRNIDEMINVLGSSDSTMVFNTQLLKDENNDGAFKVKGYDYEDDDLSDLESTIKEANIRKYVRNKEAEELLKKGKEQKKTSKRYTRKKEKKEEPKNTVKRYTRKKVVTPIEFQYEENVVETKSTVKRGRPKKSEVSEKPKRGRPKKSETAEKPKRGRPRKSETSRTKKSTTRKSKTTK